MGMLYDSLPSTVGIPLLAPYNAEIDFTHYDPAFLSYRQDTSPEILSRATDAVMAISQYAQELPDFEATWTLTVTWHDAVFYDAILADPQVVSSKIMHCVLFTECWPHSSISQTMFFFRSVDGVTILILRKWIRLAVNYYRKWFRF